MSLLTVCQNVASATGFGSITSVIGNSDPTAKQLLALVQRAGNILARVGQWPILEIQYLFNTANGVAEYSFPADFDYIIRDTVWNRNEFDIIRGPLTAQEWQNYKSGIIGSGIVKQRYRIKRASAAIANRFVLDPTPTAVEECVFEYVSKNWIADAGLTTTYQTYQDDTDVSLIDEALLELSLAWRFKREKGLDYAIDLKDYETQVEQAKSRDGTAPTIYMGRKYSYRLIGPYNIPDSGYGQ
ncbi:MAG: hypothetical protein AB7F19_07715 [Candidatus Babeliales bacterium]